jgi:outer membrane protein
MNKILRQLILIAGLGVCAATTQAEPALKPVVVDISKVLDTHYKSEELNARMEDVVKKVQEQLDQASKQLQEKGAKFQELVEKSQDSLLKPEAKAQAEAEAQKLAEEIQKLQSDAQQFRAKNQDQIQRVVRNHRDGLLEEIKVIINRLALARGATLVFDKSVSPITGVSNVLYADASYDITDEVIKEANKDRPPPPPAPVTPAPAATPAAASPAPATTAPVPAPAAK